MVYYSSKTLDYTTIKKSAQKIPIPRLKLLIYTNLDLPLAHNFFLFSAEFGLQTSDKCQQNN